MANKVVCLGEIMLRLSTPNSLRIVQADALDVQYGGSEANVAVSLAGFGFDSYFVSKLPANELGQAAVNHLRRHGVNTDHIIRGGDRLGVYFLEVGFSQRPSKVVYDRAGSAISVALPEEFDWDAIFQDCSWFHFTGITPALSSEARALTLEALHRARSHGCTVSCDINFRQKLWSLEQARDAMTELMQFVDVYIGNEQHAEDILGVVSRFEGEKGYIDSAEQLIEAYGLKSVAMTQRDGQSASTQKWAGIFFDGQQLYTSREYEIEVVDRVGGGDAFAAGLISSLIGGKGPQEALDFAVAASCLKHSIVGDCNLVSVDEVEALVAGGDSGRVQR